MGDLIPQVETPKQQQQSGKEDKKEENVGSSMSSMKTKININAEDVRSKAKESKLGKIDNEDKAKKLLEALGVKRPSITPIPQKITGSKGFYSGPNGADVTGRHYDNAIIKAKPRQIVVEWGNEVPKPEPKSSGRRIRFNMVRPSLYASVGSGFNQDKDTWLITAETSEHYFVGSVNVETALTLARIERGQPKTASETFGEIRLGEQVATIKMKSSGRVSWYDMGG